MNMENKLIFLFGMPRSGTTWIGKILDSHPDTLYMHEPDSWQRLDGIPLFPGRNYTGEGVEELMKMVSGFPKLTKAQVTSKLPIFKKNYQSSLRFYAYKASLYCSSIFYKYGVSKKISPFVRVPANWKSPLPVVWKSIESLGRLSLFGQEVDNSTCIQIIRNPAGYISSVISGESNSLFVDSTPSSEDYNLFQMLLDTEQGIRSGFSLSDLRALDPIERLAIRWQLYNEIAYENSKGHDRSQVLIYEDMCRRPIETARKLIDFCGLDWNDQTSQFLSDSISKNNGTYYSVYKNPLEAADKWQKILARDDIYKIYKILSGSDVFALYEDDFKGLI